MKSPFLEGLEGTWGRGMLVNSTGLERENLSDFFLKGLVETLVVNSSLVMLQKDLLPLPAFNVSQPPLKMKVTNSKIICPNSSKHGISPFLLFLIWQLVIKSDILAKDILILLMISWVLCFPKIEIG